MPRVALWMATLLLFVVGVTSLISPLAIMGAADIEAPTPLAISEARLIFGMLHVLIGSFFAFAALGLARIPIESALLAQAILFGFMGTARAFVIVFDDAWSQFHAQGLAINFTLLALALWGRAKVAGTHD